MKLRLHTWGCKVRQFIDSKLMGLVFVSLVVQGCGQSGVRFFAMGNGEALPSVEQRNEEDIEQALPDFSDSNGSVDGGGGDDLIVLDEDPAIIAREQVALIQEPVSVVIEPDSLSQEQATVLELIATTQVAVFENKRQESDPKNSKSAEVAKEENKEEAAGDILVKQPAEESPKESPKESMVEPEQSAIVHEQKDVVAPRCNATVGLVVLGGDRTTLSGNDMIYGDVIHSSRSSVDFKGNADIAGMIYMSDEFTSRYKEHASLMSFFTPNTRVANVKSDWYFTADGPLTVVEVFGDLVLSNHQVVITGKEAQKVIINVRGKFKLSGKSSIRTKGGIRGDNVIVNIVGSGDASLAGQAEVDVAVYAAYRSVSMSGQSAISGTLVTSKFKGSGNSSIGLAFKSCLLTQ